MLDRLPPTTHQKLVSRGIFLVVVVMMMFQYSLMNATFLLPDAERAEAEMEAPQKAAGTKNRGSLDGGNKADIAAPLSRKEGQDTREEGIQECEEGVQECEEGVQECDEAYNEIGVCRGGIGKAGGGGWQSQWSGQV